MLTPWPFGLSPPRSTAVEATQGALIQLDCWSEYWCLSIQGDVKKESSFAVVRHYAVSLLGHGTPLSKLLSVLYKTILRPLLTCDSHNGFVFLAFSTLPVWNDFTERLVAPSPPASCLPLCQFLLSEAFLSSLRVTVTHFVLSSYE